METWSNQQGERNRQAWCLLIVGDVVHRFIGDDIAKVVAVVGRYDGKDGKSSYTTFRFVLAPGVRVISGREGWSTGTFAEGLATATNRKDCDTWLEVADALGVSVASAQHFLRAWQPKAAEALDEVDAWLGEMDEIAVPPAEIVFNFGAPTRRQREGGFWACPVLILDADDVEIGCIAPNGDDWTHPVVTGPVRVLAATHASGHGGGYVSLRLIVTEGRMEK